MSGRHAPHRRGVDWLAIGCVVGLIACAVAFAAVVWMQLGDGVEPPCWTGALGHRAELV